MGGGKSLLEAAKTSWALTERLVDGVLEEFAAALTESYRRLLRYTIFRHLLDHINAQLVLVPECIEEFVEPPLAGDRGSTTGFSLSPTSFDSAA